MKVSYFDAANYRGERGGQGRVLPPDEKQKRNPSFPPPPTPSLMDRPAFPKIIAVAFFSQFSQHWRPTTGCAVGTGGREGSNFE